MKKRNPRVLLVCPLPPPVHGSSMVSNCIRESRLINGAFDVDCVNISTSRGMAEIICRIETNENLSIRMGNFERRDWFKGWRH